jgi:hypothetical protein
MLRLQARFKLAYLPSQPTVLYCMPTTLAQVQEQSHSGRLRDVLQAGQPQDPGVGARTRQRYSVRGQRHRHLLMRYVRHTS